MSKHRGLQSISLSNRPIAAVLHLLILWKHSLIEKAQIQSFVLAGGQSRRFNGEDKGLKPLAGKPMAQHVIERAAPQTAEIAISCNRNRDEYAQLLQQYDSQLNVNTHSDPQTSALDASDDDKYLRLCYEDELGQSFSGPLAGIFRCLMNCNYEYAFFCPCDTPLLPENIVKQLASEMYQYGADAAYPRSQAQNHYLVLLVATKVGLRQLKSLLSNAELAAGQPNRDKPCQSNQKKGFAVKEWLAMMDCRQVHVSDSIGFSNVNNNTELKDIKKIAFRNNQ